MNKTYYDLLEVAETASQEEIRSAYRILAQEYHPDKLPEELRNRRVGKDAVETLLLIKDAYEVLSHSQKRAAYDRKLRELRGSKAEPNVSSPPPPPAPVNTPPEQAPPLRTPATRPGGGGGLFGNATAVGWGVAALLVILVIVGVGTLQHGVRQQVPEGPSTGEVPSSSEQQRVQATPSRADWQLDQELTTLRDLEARQKIGGRILVDIARALPELLWLDRLKFGAEGISIEGRAFNTNAVANFIANLDRLADFSEPTLKDAAQTSGGVYRFVLAMEREKPTEPIVQGHLGGLLETERDNLFRHLAPQAQINETLRRIRTLTEGATLQIKEFLPGTPQEAGIHIKNLPLSLQIGAVSSHELAQFLDRLSHFSPLVTLREMVVTAEGQRTAASLSLEIQILKNDVRLPPGTVERDGIVKKPEAELPKFRREPFRSLLEVEPGKNSVMPRGIRPEGIPGLLIDELELRAIGRVSQGYVAQVKNGEKTYLLKEGAQLYDGNVVSISKKEIVFKQIVQDPTALSPFREVVKALSPS